MTFARFLATACAALVLACAARLPAAAASDATAVMATVNHFVHDFNAGDDKATAADCTSDAIVIDNFPPHVWRGPATCGQWAAAYDAFAKGAGIADEIVTLAAPWHVDVSGDRAYVVVPAKDTYLQHGKQVTFVGSVFTVALAKIGGRWTITGWAWSDH